VPGINRGEIANVTTPPRPQEYSIPPLVWTLLLLMFLLICSKFVSHKFGKRPADAQPKSAEVADDDPGQRKDVESSHPRPANQRGNSDHRHSHWE
jgi:hypothetical protein